MPPYVSGWFCAQEAKLLNTALLIGQSVHSSSQT